MHYKISIITVFFLLIIQNELLHSACTENNYKLQKWAYLVKDTINRQVSYSYLKDVIPGTDVISITGYKLNSKGFLIYSREADSRFFSFVKKYKTVIYPLISFVSAKEGKLMLSSRQARSNAVNEIITLIEKYFFKGIHLDFEYLKPESVNSLVLFLNELKSSCADINLTMAIFPQIGFPKEWSGFHDLGRISGFLDEIVIMCYDMHRPGTPPGPVVDIDWAEKNINIALKYMDRSKVWLGVPAYGYVWDEKGGRPSVITAGKGKSESARYSGYRHQSGTLFYKYKKAGKSYIVYFADIVTISNLAKLAERYCLKGTALWRLGFEEKQYWD